MHTKGLIFDVKRFAIHDGPGIRTTVFLKGCPLTCVWCENPEGISTAVEVAYDPTRCIGCARCVSGCPEGAHSVRSGKHVYDRSRCRTCGLCAAHCPTEAVRLVGYEATVADVLDVALRDRVFYERSGGGVTLSGGEPMAQPEFCAEMLAAAQAEGLHTCVDTSGSAPWSHFESVLPLVGLFLYDIKDTDARRHRDNTGAAPRLILDNLRRLDAAGASLILRCPIVPGVNDDEEHFRGLAELWGALGTRPAIELVPYHRLGEGKLLTLGKAEAQRSFPSAESDTLIRWAETLTSHGVQQVEVSGA